MTAEDPAPTHPLVTDLVTRARNGDERAWAALPRADAHTLFAAEIMGRTYFALLRLIEHRQFRVFGERVSVPTSRKLVIALRSWIRSRWGERRS